MKASLFECALIAAIVGILSVSGIQSWNRYHAKPVCADERVVAEIIKVAYRNTMYRDTTGQYHTVNQGTYQVGDTMCLKWK